MAIPQEHLDVVVNDDGSVRIPAAEVSRLGARPGEHLQLVRDEVPSKRNKVRGLLSGKFDSDELLTKADFDAAHKSNVAIAEQKLPRYLSIASSGQCG